MSDWTGLWELRWSVRSLIAYGAIAFLILTAPITAAALDDQGLPGGIIILGAITIAAVASGYAVYTSLPSRRRARAMEELARSLDLPFSRRFTLPEELHALPFRSLIPLGTWSIGSGCIGEREDRPIVVFSRSYTFDDYEATIWRSCAVTWVPLEAPLLRVEHGHLGVHPGGPQHGMKHLQLELERFDRMWRVETRDERFAAAFIDQRMMAWLMTVEGDYAFEAGGSWAMAETAGDDEAALEDLVAVLDAFVAHIPRAVLSMYPAD